VRDEGSAKLKLMTVSLLFYFVSSFFIELIVKKVSLESRENEKKKRKIIREYG